MFSVQVFCVVFLGLVCLGLCYSITNKSHMDCFAVACLLARVLAAQSSCWVRGFADVKPILNFFQLLFSSVFIAITT